MKNRLICSKADNRNIFVQFLLKEGDFNLSRLKIYNAKIITPARVIENGTVLVENGKIVETMCRDADAEDCMTIDAKGMYLSPGFIDIHTHGGGGYDFMDLTQEAFLGAAAIHATHGTTSIVPTALTGSIEELKKIFSIFRQAKKNNEKGAQLLGLHLEGPYLSQSQKGAQNPIYIRNPNPSEYMEILSLSDDILRWSAAPELEGSLEFARILKKRGILPCIAHTDATYEQVEEAYENGFTHITHLYSSMSSVTRVNAYRVAGAVEAAFLIDGLTVEIIADGKHLPPALLKLVYKIKGPDKIALVTDSMRAAGMSDGASVLGSINDGMQVIVEDGVAKLPDRTSFAGSVATADRLVRTMVNSAQVPIEQAVNMMSTVPAKIIGLGDRKGRIVPGYDADLIIFDSQVKIYTVIIGGNVVYLQNLVNE
jgi:N-acetylglucosamine-6-phosphate deacetylase